MKRTPRSARRRASRQFDANEPSPGLAPYISRMFWGSLLMSIRPGTLDCILKGHFVLGNPGENLRIAHCTVLDFVERIDGLNRSILQAAVNPLWVLDKKHRSAEGVELDPLEFARQEAGRPLP